MVISNWKFRLGETLVILDYGYEMPEEVKFPQRSGLDVVPSPDSAWPLLLATGNAEVVIKFSVLWPFAGDKETRANLMDSLAVWSNYPMSYLYVQVKGYTDRYWLFSQCLVNAVDMEIVITRRGPKAMHSYTLTCAGLSRVGP
jgi:hypothetical protein